MAPEHLIPTGVRTIYIMQNERLPVTFVSLIFSYL